MRECRKCGESKPPTEFWKHPLGRDGLDPWCKDCKRAKNKAWHDRQPKHPRQPRLSAEQCAEARQMYVDGSTQPRIARHFGVSESLIGIVLSDVVLTSFRCPHCGTTFDSAAKRAGHISGRHVRWPENDSVTKVCSRCQTEKHIDEFYVRNRATTGRGWGRNPYCRDCSKVMYQERRAQVADRERERRYGLSKDAYRQFLDDHNRQCAICSSTTRLVIDHDHATGKVRGLLCSQCNAGIGCLGDEPERLEAAASYLRRSREEPEWPISMTQQQVK